MVRHIARLDRENQETLHPYAEFVAEPTDYVLNQLVDAVLGMDRDFIEWPAQHPESRVRQAFLGPGRAPEVHDLAPGSLQVPATG